MNRNKYLKGPILVIHVQERCPHCQCPSITIQPSYDEEKRAICNKCDKDVGIIDYMVFDGINSVKPIKIF